MTREEALQAIKAKMDYYESDKRLRGALETLIPELAESKDERIRKELVAFFKEMRDTWHEIYWHDLQVEGILAWLEKQKEPQYAIRVTKGFGDPAGPQFELVDLQKEQKPAEWSDYKDKVNVPYCSSEPEWSEEDELMMKAVIGILDESDHPKLCHWLKSLKPQPKQEWSEEDENARQNLIAHFEGKILKLSGEAKKEAVDWLKSLRPSWKPSEEQPEVDLENEIQGYIQKLGFGYGGWVDGLSDEDLKNIARHFYELGLKASKEQPVEYPTSTEMIAEWENNELPMLREKDFRGDVERMAYNAFLDGFAKGLEYRK